MKALVKDIRNGITGSYSQVFFSDNPWLAVCILLASFADPYIGASGLISLLIALVAGRLLGLSPAYLNNGTYTYNVLLAGMALGAAFQFTGLYVVILVIAALLTLLITVWLSSFLARYKLPFLSLPFIFSAWIVLLNARVFPPGVLVDRNVFLCEGAFCNSMAYAWSQSLGLSSLPSLLQGYFKAMAAIFFQNNLLAGVVIALGLLIHSRIAFCLSWLGFLSGYGFFWFSHGPFAIADYMGINYIFMALALGGFYTIPSAGSYALVVISAPVMGLMHSALGKIIGPYYLPLYSLPFSVAVIIILSVLNNRYYFRMIHLVQYQLFSPEKNLYAFHTYMERFKKDTYVHVHLPFYGEWTVSQGHNGRQTHKDDFRFAWDFVVTDEHHRTYRLPGKQVTDFYCYNLPVLAPADGFVVTVKDGVDDNAVRDVNLAENWGNTIIIKHSDLLYSKISHIKKDSFKVKEGDHVKKGEMLALCGSSGRSPEPHIHFQLQATSYIGAQTLEYPISYYIVKKESGYRLRSFSYPEENEVIVKPSATPLLKKAFHFIPGMRLSFELKTGAAVRTETWEVFTNSANDSYFYCEQTRSIAAFKNNDTLFYFTGFSGDKTSLLYYFYLAAYKVLLSYFPDMEVEDKMAVNDYYHGPLKPLQDVVAPFFVFIRPVYRATFGEADNSQAPGAVTLVSSVSQGPQKMDFELHISDNKIKTIRVKQTSVWLSAENIG